MRLGFALPISGAWATPDNITSIARDADAAGFAGAWTFQRWLATDQLDGVYQSVLDPLILLGYAAAVTERIRLGLAIVNGPFYSPVAIAKQFAALDVLSNGRLDGGVGLGWSPLEYAAAGVPKKARGRRYDEWLDCLDLLLTSEQVEFSGEFYTVPASTIAPRPVQRPRPPLLLGGSSEAALVRAATRGDGWISSSRASVDEIAQGVAVVRAAAMESGKEPSAVRCVVRGVTVLHDSPIDGERRPLSGSLEQIRDDLKLFASKGVDEVFLDLNFDSARVGTASADPAFAMDLAARLMPLGAETF